MDEKLLSFAVFVLIWVGWKKYKEYRALGKRLVLDEKIKKASEYPCPKCNGQISKDATKCNYCGSSLIPPTEKTRIKLENKDSVIPMWRCSVCNVLVANVKQNSIGFPLPDICSKCGATKEKVGVREPIES